MKLLLVIVILFPAYVFSATPGSEEFSPQAGPVEQASPVDTPGPIFGEPEILPVGEAFQLTATRDENAIELRWQIRPGYYLYRQRFSFDAANGQLGQPELPPGIRKHDEYFGDVEVYYDELVLTLPVLHAEDAAIELVVGYQGCAEDRFCYPMQKTTITAEKMQGISANVQVDVFAGSRR